MPFKIPTKIHLGWPLLILKHSLSNRTAATARPSLSRYYISMSEKPQLFPDPEAASLNLQDAETAVDVFNRAALANLNDPRRVGSSIFLPDKGRLVITGDIHDNARNYRCALKLADLDASEQNYLILHELIHGPNFINGCDMSIRLLLKAAALKLQYPMQVLFLQANHELAQHNNDSILKNSVNVIGAFDEGIEYIFYDDADKVRQAMKAYIKSLPLAIRCENGIFISHSLPGQRQLESSFDPSVIDRTPTDEDYENGGSAHQLVWGRKHSQAVADKLGELWNAKLFVMGHQKVEMGFDIQGSNMLIMASDHNHGMGLPIDLSKTYDLQGLVDGLEPLAGVML